MSGLSICLCVIFNHNHEINVPLLREIYKDRFDKIIFLMPFYQGNDPEIFPYFEKSHYFQASINFNYHRLKEINASHYFFISDDLLINNSINKHNLFDWFGGENTISIPYHPEDVLFLAPEWYHLSDMFLMDEIAKPIEWRKYLPSNEEMKMKKEMMGFRNHVDISYYVDFLRNKGIIIPEEKISNFELPYPFAYGYSDIFVMPAEKLERFSYYAGVTTAMKLWVEIAIPTIVLMVCDKIDIIEFQNNVDDPGKYGMIGGHHNEFCSAAQFTVSKAFKGKFENLSFYHPVKLSNSISNENMQTQFPKWSL